MDFNEWIFLVVEYIGSIKKWDSTTIFSSINLGDAKLHFLDGIPPNDVRNLDLINM